MNDVIEKLAELLKKCPDIIRAWDCEYEDAAADLIANGVRLEEKQATSDGTSEWVSVKDECPKFIHRKWYKVHGYDGDHEYYSSGFVAGLVDGKPVIVEYCREGASCPWRDKALGEHWFDESGKRQDVTHWAPLPKLPKG